MKPKRSPCYSQHETHDGVRVTYRVYDPELRANGTEASVDVEREVGNMLAITTTVTYDLQSRLFRNWPNRWSERVRETAEFVLSGWKP